MRIDGAPPIPDGPPPTAREIAQFRLLLANGVEEGYAAFYSQDDMDEVGVYAVRLAPSEIKRWNPTNDARFEFGRVVAFISGRKGECFEPIRQYLAGLGKQ
jgi:hypothetical protein